MLVTTEPSKVGDENPLTMRLPDYGVQSIAIQLCKCRTRHNHEL